MIQDICSIMLFDDALAFVEGRNSDKFENKDLTDSRRSNFDQPTDIDSADRTRTAAGLCTIP